MPQLYFSTHSYRSQSQDLAEERLINCYPERSLQGAKSQVPVIGVPGVADFATPGAGPIWGMHVLNNVLYVVSGGTFWSVNSAGTATFIGVVEGSRRVHMSDNGTQISIVNGLYGYIYNISTSTFSKTVLGLDSDFTIAVAGAGPSSVEVTITLTEGPATANNANQIYVSLTADAGAAQVFAELPASGDTIADVATALAATINADADFAASAVGGVITVTPAGGTTNLTAASGTAAAYQVTLTVSNKFTTDEVVRVDVEMTGEDTVSVTYKVLSSDTAATIATAIQTALDADPLLTATVSSNVVTVHAANEEITDIDATVSWITRSGAFPRTERVCFLDGYFIWPVTDSQQFKISNVNDGTAVFGTASETTAADDVVSAVVVSQRLYVLGETTTVVYQNTGNVDFPFERIPGATIERGCAAPHSIGKGENTFAWLGNDRVVYAVQGYSPLRISTHGVENRINTYTVIADAFAFVISWKGHRFYVLTFPTESVTWIYDAATQEWHERISYDANAEDDSGNSRAFVMPSGAIGETKPTPGSGLKLVDAGTEHHCVVRDFGWSPELGMFFGAGSITTTGGGLASYDGIKWVHVPISDASQFLGVAWSADLSKWAMNDSTDIYNSRDGITWTQQTETGSNYSRMIWVEKLGLFIVGISDTSTPLCYTSPDGATWTQRTGTAASIRDLAWSPELSLAVAVGTASDGTGRARYSSNGTTWSNGTVPAGTDSWRGVAWAPGLSLFCAVGGGTNQVMTSTDGQTWTARTADPVGQTWLDVEWSEELSLFVACSSGGKLMSSANGTAWTERTSPVGNNPSGGWFALGWSPDLRIFALGGDNLTEGVQVASSTDGINWTARVF